MKKALVFLLVLTIGFQAFAGGKSETAVVSDDPVMQYAGTTLNLIMEQNATTDAIEALVPQFEELTGIDVVIEKAPYDDVIQKETLAFVSGQGAYDLISAPYEYLGNMVVNGYIQSIEPFLEGESLIEGFDKNDRIEALWAACGDWEGTLYGTPENLCTMFYAYRKDLFENETEKADFLAKYGYELAIPTTWQQYRDIAEFFTREKGELLAGEPLAQAFYGVSMSGKRHQATVFEWMNYMWSFGGNIFDEEGNIAIDDEKTIEALQYYVDLTEFAPPGVSSKTWDEQTTELQQGIVAQAICFNDCTPSIENPDESLMVGKYGYAQYPAGEKQTSHFGGWGYYIPTDAKNPEAAWLFLEWFLSYDVQRNLAENGFFPSLASLYDDESLNSIPYWEASKVAFENSTSRPRIPQWNSMCEVMQLEISMAIAGEETAEQACRNMAAEFNEILAGALPVTYQ